MPGKVTYLKLDGCLPRMGHRHSSTQTEEIDMFDAEAQTRIEQVDVHDAEVQTSQAQRRTMGVGKQGVGERTGINKILGYMSSKS